MGARENDIFLNFTLDKQENALYNTQAFGGNAAIAQPVERILGKDEVASSNLASSSNKTSGQSAGRFLNILPEELATESQARSAFLNKRSEGFPKSVAFWEAGSQFKSGELLQ